MAAISETLRQARLRSGVDLDRLAAKTKIHPRYLEAIETGNFEKLPSGIFARMFIKQYADAVGLDGASFAEEYQRNSQFGGLSSADPGGHSRGDFHPVVPAVFSTGERVRNEKLTNALSSLIWALAAILVCAGAYYFLAHLPSRHAVVTVAHPPETTSPSRTTSAPPVPLNAKPTADAVQAAPANPPAQETTASVGAAGGSTTQPVANAPIHIVLSPTETVWVTAIADGKTVISEALQPGTTKAIDAASSARVTLGNAGGVDITFNGRKLEPFGPRGQVRTVDFTSWGAQAVARTPPKADRQINPDPLN